MKILKKQIVAKNGEGFVKMQADESEDMYSLYNLIANGDFVTSSTTRNVVSESNTGSVRKKGIRLTVKIQVERVDFDIEQCSLRLTGRNVEENEHIKRGQYHTVELEVGHPFTIEKDCWDSLYMQQLQEACDPSNRAELAAIVMQEGLAHICLITNSMTVTKAKIEKTVSKKKQGADLDKAKAQFFAEIFEGIRKHINFAVVKALLLGSPGFLKDDFMVFFEEQCVRIGDTPLLRQKSKFFKAHTTSGHKHSIDEILSDPGIRTQVLDVKAAGEVRALERFNSTLSSDQYRACYGLKDCVRANDQLAVDELLVTDTLFKAPDVKTRQTYVALVDSVRENGGTVHVFSCLHVSGVQLNLYTGIAAILRHPMPDIDEEEPEAVTSSEAVTSAVGITLEPTTSRGGESSARVDNDIFDMNDVNFDMLSF